MALAQLAQPESIDFAALIQIANERYADAIRAVACEALEGEDIDERKAALAHAYGIDPMTVAIQIEEQIDLLTN